MKSFPNAGIRAKGSGAYGTFTVTHDISQLYPSQGVLQTRRQDRSIHTILHWWPASAALLTPNATSAASPSSSIPTEGNWDLVGNNTPVFFLRDPLKHFPDLNHVVKRDPRTNLRSAAEQLGLLDPPARGAPSDNGRHERPRHPPRATAICTALAATPIQLLSTRTTNASWVKFHFRTAAGHQKPDRRRSRSSLSPRTAKAIGATSIEAHREGRLPPLDPVHSDHARSTTPRNCPTIPLIMTKVWYHKRLSAHRSGRTRTEPQSRKLSSRRVEQAAFTSRERGSRHQFFAGQDAAGASLLPTATRSATASA